MKTGDGEGRENRRVSRKFLPMAWGWLQDGPRRQRGCQQAPEPGLTEAKEEKQTEDPVKSADATAPSGCREIGGSNNSHHLSRPYYVRNSLNALYFYLVSSWQQPWRWYISQGSLYYERQSRSSSNGDGRKYVGLLRELEENPRN